jgi:glycosyltransferase involved in cell wall biosynthesis
VFSPHYFARTLGQTKNAMPYLFDYYDALLLQNVDSLRLLTEEAHYKKVIIRIGGIDIRGVSGMEEVTKYDQALKRVSAVIATNNKLLGLAQRNNANSALIPNGIDLNVFKPKERLPSERFTVGFAGNISDMRHMQYKGYPLIAGAVTELYNEVAFKTALHGHEQIAHIDMVPSFYHKIDCLINASVDEGCSNVIMEALACGVPVVCTKVGYHGEMLTHKENVLFVERNTSAIADAIMRLRSDATLCAKLAAGGRLFAIKNHNIVNVVNQYRTIINRVLTLT